MRKFLAIMAIFPGMVFAQPFFSKQETPFDMEEGVYISPDAVAVFSNRGIGVDVDKNGVATIYEHGKERAVKTIEDYQEAFRVIGAAVQPAMGEKR